MKPNDLVSECDGLAATLHHLSYALAHANDMTVRHGLLSVIINTARAMADESPGYEMSVPCSRLTNHCFKAINLDLSGEDPQRFEDMLDVSQLVEDVLLEWQKVSGRKI